MKLFFFIICVVFVTVIRSCTGNEDKDDSEAHHIIGNVETDKVENDCDHSNFKSIPRQKSESKKVDPKQTSSKLHLNDETAAKSTQQAKMPVSKLQQSIQISEPKKQERKPNAKLVMAPLIVQRNGKLALQVPRKLIQVDLSANDNKRRQNDIINDDKNNEARREVTPKTKTPSDEIKAQSEKSKHKKTLKPDQGKDKLKDEANKKNTTSERNQDVKKPDEVKNKSSNINIKSDISVIDSKVEDDNFTKVDNINSDILPIDDEEEEKSIDESPPEKITSEIQGLSSVIPEYDDNPVKEMKSENQAPKLINLFDSQQQLKPISNDLQNILKEPIDLVIKNEDIQELTEKPNSSYQAQDISRSATSPPDQNTQYYSYAPYDYNAHEFQWHVPTCQPANEATNSYKNLDQYWTNPVTYESGNYNNLQNYKPDNTFTPPPYKYPYEEQFRGAIEAFSRQRNLNSNNYKQNGNPTYYWTRNRPCIPYQNSTYNKKNNPLSYCKYNERRIPNKNLDRVWRHWHTTQVTINSKKSNRV